MTKSVTSLLAFVVFNFFVLNVSSTTPTWANTESSSYGHERKTVLQFYFHDNRTGDSPTAALIAQPLQGNVFASGFGSLVMADDPLTLSPDPNSKLVGRAQGLYGLAAQKGVNILMGFSYGFVDGIYNGSSVVAFGLNLIGNPVRELPIVGGTGIFRMARGYALSRTYFHDATLLNTIVEYNVTVFHH